VGSRRTIDCTSQSRKSAEGGEEKRTSYLTARRGKRERCCRRGKKREKKVRPAFSSFFTEKKTRTEPSRRCLVARRTPRNKRKRKPRPVSAPESMLSEKGEKKPRPPLFFLPATSLGNSDSIKDIKEKERKRKKGGHDHGISPWAFISQGKRNEDDIPEFAIYKALKWEEREEKGDAVNTQVRLTEMGGEREN